MGQSQPNRLPGYPLLGMTAFLRFSQSIKGAANGLGSSPNLGVT